MSILEYTVLIFLVSGYTSQEIERELGVSSKVIDNARTRVKSKLSRILLQVRLPPQSASPP